jgi:hypothetical protein
MYDPAIGKWLSEDPEGVQNADPNLYRYQVNQPTRAFPVIARQGEVAKDVCTISKVTLVTTKAQRPAFLTKGFMPAFPRIKGPAQENELGPHNDPNMKGNLQHVFWVVWEGTNMKDCEIRTYQIRTETARGKTENYPAGSKGFVAGQKIGVAGSRRDGPRPVAIWPPNPTKVIVVADAPGWVNAKPGDYPLKYQSNFYSIAVSKKDGKVKGEIWYDVVIDAPRAGDVDENKVTLVDSRPKK